MNWTGNTGNPVLNKFWNRKKVTIPIPEGLEKFTDITETGKKNAGFHGNSYSGWGHLWSHPLPIPPPEFQTVFIFWRTTPKEKKQSIPKPWPSSCSITFMSINIALINQPCTNLTAHTRERGSASGATGFPQAVNCHWARATSFAAAKEMRLATRQQKDETPDRCCFPLWQSFLYFLGSQGIPASLVLEAAGWKRVPASVNALRWCVRQGEWAALAHAQTESDGSKTF